ncbi:TPA: hypothetical protein ACUJK1_001001 [Streptococcus agalactiae]|uniref:hypothetical protein n=1 Tax=Streptococcus agalactiae TaxID=1311 RepID=UPI0002BAB1D0|nr:hypothetical protein [Streptococcus agalactiae]EPT90718.1 hypothetical protein SAG0104_04935 [Streptococcus agalactiae BSU178]KLJ84256.1 hypothetical protein WB01_07735 [Streptococcus agalactiae]KLL20370.1 hypothetical protein VZ96_07070 [Streptococcus agalactiae]KLL30085.1 hypothetical protein WA02_11450 [Streptococcus agalactiae]KLL82663.1 hypothetical protein WA05_07315 [Streptococcus agalactiae]
MTKNRLDKFSTTYRKEIIWLRWYFMRDKNNPSLTILEKKISDCILYRDYRTYNKFSAISKIISEMIDKTDNRMVTALKEVYVYRNISVIGAAQSILYLSQTQAYVHIRGWFEEFENCLFDKVFLEEI